MSIEAILEKIDADQPAALERLFELLRIQSVSTDPAYADHCVAAADWLVNDLKSLGFEAERRDTPGHPMVVAHGGEGGPHFLFYGHYDVQPVDPLNLWDSPPFEPVLKDTPNGKVISARGANDDKGQLMTFLEALRAWVAVNGKLPCRLTIFLEGEEETGSPSLVPFMKENAEELTADLAMICDTAMWDRETPAISTMLRGMVGVQVTVHAADRDLHSGMYGGAAINPIRVLNRILSDMHDDDGRVTLDGFYDGVHDIPDEVKAQWDGLNFSTEDFLGEVGLSVPAGETGYTALEQTWARPTAEVNGIWGGYTGEGFKTVLPAEAHAKVTFRLVGDQDPDAVVAAFKAHVEASLPADCSASFVEKNGAKATVLPVDATEFTKAHAALSDEWPKPAVFAGCGGSIPIAGLFHEILGMDSLMIGFGQSDDALHSPNEKYDLASFHKGARSWARVLAALT
ncbi:dipeptidase [Amaricoccus tamworthensis]|uniref:dipeptidase n=1 Tax=Amaricoccus tamworthensis TaxID=57002 RepID=UPI003C7C5906